MSARAALLRFLRVPHAPAAPGGDDGVRVFRAARNYYWYRLLHWAVAQAGAVFGLAFGLVLLGQVHTVLPEAIELGALTLTESTILTLLTIFEVLAITAVVAQAAFSLALLRLDFEQRWYLVSDRSLRIREGIVKLHEKTMTFANIQHVAIRQGPVQRLFGIADLEVRTAGGGGKTDEAGVPKDDLHVGFFRGIADAERIRDAIRDRLRRHRDAGLGDPDDADTGGYAGEAGRPRTIVTTSGRDTAGAVALADAATALRREAAELRLALQR